MFKAILIFKAEVFSMSMLSMTASNCLAVIMVFNPWEYVTTLDAIGWHYLEQ